MVRIEESGKYLVRCGNDHSSEVVLGNLKFELLFEYGLSSLFDGYTREAVSSFAAAMERAQEFYWRTVMAHLSVPKDSIEKSWRSIAKQSERQLGAYITAGLAVDGKRPPLLNPNKEVKFRNDVIHSGYLPSQSEAVEFGDTVMNAINAAIEVLRHRCPISLLETYASMSPAAPPSAPDNQGHFGTINVLTAIDVRFPPVGDDVRVGGVLAQFPRIQSERQPRRMTLLSDAEARKRFPERYFLREQKSC